MRLLGTLLASVLVVGLASGCSCEDDTKTAPPKPTATTPPVEAGPPPSKAESVTFESDEGVTLKGDFYLAPDPTSPILVFVHGFRGHRSEWKPVVDQAAAAPKRYTILAFDLRGHGESHAASDGGKVIGWATMEPEDVPKLVDDVTAAARYALKRTDDKARSVVLVGSSLGAALVAKAAAEAPKVAAVGLVSPGAAIHGFDVYRPFAAVRDLPAFLAGAKTDNVSIAPIAALEKMAKNGTVKHYEGEAHGVRHLGPQAWQDLGAWLDDVYDAVPKNVPVKAGDAGRVE